MNSAAAPILAVIAFPINRCHQRVVTQFHYDGYCTEDEFPINRFHQRVVTYREMGVIARLEPSFQSIGVTNEW